MCSYVVILRAVWWLLGSSGQMKLIKSTKCRLTFIFSYIATEVQGSKYTKRRDVQEIVM